MISSTNLRYPELMLCPDSGFSYILDDSTDFAPTQYKVLLGREEGFVRCMKMRFNGRVQLYYMTGGLQPLPAAFPGLRREAALNCLLSLLGSILEVKHNGFLSCTNIDPDLNHVFVEPGSCGAQLVYLPVTEHITEDAGSFERLVKTGLFRLLTGSCQLNASESGIILSMLDSDGGSLESIYEALTEIGGSTEKSREKTEKKPLRACLVSADRDYQLRLEIDKDSYVIGRGRSADGLLTARTIGHIHCRVERNGDEFTLTDLDSRNGSYVNGMRLQPRVPCPINSGDRVRLADVPFVFTLE